MLAKYVRYVVKNYLFAVLALLFTLLYWLSAKDLPPKATDFPRALYLVIVPMLIWNFISSVRGFQKTLKAEGNETEKWNCNLNITVPKVVVTVATILYIVLMPVIGFVITTVLYLAVLSFYLGIRKPLNLTLFAIGYTAVLYGVFVLWLNVRLPGGILI